MSFYFVYNPVKIKNNSDEWLDVPPILLAIQGNMRVSYYVSINGPVSYYYDLGRKPVIHYYAVFKNLDEARRNAVGSRSSVSRYGCAYPIFEVEGDFENLPLDEERGERYLTNSNDITLLSASLAHAYPEDSEHAKHAEKIDLRNMQLTSSQIAKVCKANQDKLRDKGEELTQREINACLFERDVKRKYDPIWKKDNFIDQLMNASFVLISASMVFLYGAKLLTKKIDSFPRAIAEFLIASSALGLAILSAYRFFFGSLQAPTINLIEEEEKFEKLAYELRKKHHYSEKTLKITSYLDAQLENAVMKKNNNFLPRAIHEMEQAIRLGGAYINDCCQRIEEGTFVQPVESLPRASSSSSCCS